jgi:hypothetical protein
MNVAPVSCSCSGFILQPHQPQNTYEACDRAYATADGADQVFGLERIQMQLLNLLDLDLLRLGIAATRNRMWRRLEPVCDWRTNLRHPELRNLRCHPMIRERGRPACSGRRRSIFPSIPLPRILEARPVIRKTRLRSFIRKTSVSFVGRGMLCVDGSRGLQQSDDCMTRDVGFETGGRAHRCVWPPFA